MPKAFCITGAVVAILLLLVFGIDLIAAGFPFDRQSLMIDIGMVICSGDVGLHQLGTSSDAQIADCVLSGRAIKYGVQFMPTLAIWQRKNPKQAHFRRPSCRSGWRSFSRPAPSRIRSRNTTTPPTFMRTACSGDPGNFEYLQCLIGVLQKRYVQRQKARPHGAIQGPQREGAAEKGRCQERLGRSDAAGHRRRFWPIRGTPPTLTQMATACGGILKEEGMGSR